eukprot:TRINITY_DN19896_c0_g1_i1.p1 TRINITY_DN19896_c0_g1~~TRINITY_DN19896_c0_g1_i1.p1  ORF type:complete len:751 (-),score=132.59 TRINITY_DN19896_c0_g1_i1:355-2607(-)
MKEVVAPGDGDGCSSDESFADSDEAAPGQHRAPPDGESGEHDRRAPGTLLRHTTVGQPAAEKATTAPPRSRGFSDVSNWSKLQGKLHDRKVTNRRQTLDNAQLAEGTAELEGQRKPGRRLSGIVKELEERRHSIAITGRPSIRQIYCGDYLVGTDRACRLTEKLRQKDEPFLIYEKAEYRRQFMHIARKNILKLREFDSQPDARQRWKDVRDATLFATRSILAVRDFLLTLQGIRNARTEKEEANKLLLRNLEAERLERERQEVEAERRKSSEFDEVLAQLLQASEDSSSSESELQSLKSESATSRSGSKAASRAGSKRQSSKRQSSKRQASKPGDVQRKVSVLMPDVPDVPPQLPASCKRPSFVEDPEVSVTGAGLGLGSKRYVIRSKCDPADVVARLSTPRASARTPKAVPEMFVTEDRILVTRHISTPKVATPTSKRSLRRYASPQTPNRTSSKIERLFTGKRCSERKQWVQPQLWPHPKAQQPTWKRKLQMEEADGDFYTPSVSPVPRTPRKLTSPLPNTDFFREAPLCGPAEFALDAPRLGAQRQPVGGSKNSQSHMASVCFSSTMSEQLAKRSVECWRPASPSRLWEQQTCVVPAECYLPRPTSRADHAAKYYITPALSPVGGQPSTTDGGSAWWNCSLASTRGGACDSEGELSPRPPSVERSSWQQPGETWEDSLMSLGSVCRGAAGFPAPAPPRAESPQAPWKRRLTCLVPLDGSVTQRYCESPLPRSPSPRSWAPSRAGFS